MTADLRLAYHNNYTHAHLDDLDLDARSQCLCRGKQHVSYGNPTAQVGKLMHAIILNAHARFDDLELENVVILVPLVFFFFKQNKQRIISYHHLTFRSNYWSVQSPDWPVIYFLHKKYLLITGK